MKRKAKDQFHRSEAKQQGTNPDIAKNPDQNGEKTALPPLPAIAHARRQKWVRLNSNPNAHFKLTDELEAEICQYVADGLSFSDAARLAGIYRGTSLEWKNRGDAYWSDPIANAEDERFGRYVVMIEEAELAAKRLLIQKVARDPDWRAAMQLLKSRYKVEFSELSQTNTELSGPGGMPLQTGNPFHVHFSVSGPEEKIDFTTVDHRTPAEIARDGALADNRVPDPFGKPSSFLTAPQQRKDG